jgi:NAD(P)-dependent dehydrogenase (short-subunit alcohol dehydrogenase family)
LDYRDRHVVVTGGTGVLGNTVVGALVEAGALCHVPFVSARETERIPWHGHERVKLVGPVDLTDENAVAGLYRDVPGLWASIHLAGGFTMSPICLTRKSDLMKQINLNLVSAFLCCAAAVGVMTRGGRIVNVAARIALEWRAGSGMAAYAASKAAVAALTVALAEEVVKDGILVNAVAPSIMDTPANRAAMPQADAEEVVKDGILVNAVAPSIMDTPANRAAMPQADYSAWPKVEEVAATILYLASPQNTVARGSVVPVYGRS